MLRRMYFLGILVTLTVAPTGYAQTGALLDGLRSTNWHQRETTVAELRRLAADAPSIMHAPVVREAVIRLLERENTFLRAGNRTGSIAAGELEAFGEYYSGELLPAAMQLLPDATPAELLLLIRALVNGAYNSDSPFIRRISAYGEYLVTPVLELVRSNMAIDRANAYAVMGQVISESRERRAKYPLTSRSLERLTVTLRNGLQDPNAAVRRDTIRAIVGARDRESIPMLVHLSQTDRDVGTGKAQYSVRHLAAEARFVERAKAPQTDRVDSPSFNEGSGRAPSRA